MSVKTIPLMNQEQLLTGCSHMIRLKVADLLTLAAAAGATTSLTVPVAPYVARDVIDRAMFDLVTPFDGGATSELTVKFGYNGATVDDDDAFIEARSIHLDATEILADAGSADTATIDNTYGSQEAGVLGSLRAKRPFAAQEAGTLELVFTSTGANISALTAGEIIVYFNHLRLPSLRGING